mmetsp:Transcript_75185/g.110194  ORF Transcript_75185/g.110194 Transcript_75185/m.110194 type:complete len:217 (+) Transcript_75185:468-1118(+)
MHHRRYFDARREHDCSKQPTSCSGIHGPRSMKAAHGMKPEKRLHGFASHVDLINKPHNSRSIPHFRCAKLSATTWISLSLQFPQTAFYHFIPVHLTPGSEGSPKQTITVGLRVSGDTLLLSGDMHQGWRSFSVSHPISTERANRTRPERLDACLPTRGRSQGLYFPTPTSLSRLLSTSQAHGQGPKASSLENAWMRLAKGELIEHMQNEVDSGKHT